MSRLRLYLGFASATSGHLPRAEQCWLDTGAPLTVIPHRLQHFLAWQASRVRSTWRGIACVIGSIQIWVPVSNYSGLRGPFGVIAKFPLYEPLGPPSPVLLGLEFLESNALLELALRSPAAGSLIVH